MENIKQNYLDNLEKKLLEAYSKQDLKIISFLYKTIFDQQYYEIRGYCEKKLIKNSLNIEIGNKLLYPFKDQIFVNTQQAITFIPLFIMFAIGTNIEIDECIQFDEQKIWNSFQTGVAYFIKRDRQLAEDQFEKFKDILEMKGQQYFALDLNKSLQSIQNYLSGKELLKLINLMFFQDCLSFAIKLNEKKFSQTLQQSQQINSDEFLQFQSDQRKGIIMNILKYIQQYHINDVKDTIDYYKMQVAASFLETNYDYDYIDANFDYLKAGQTIFNLIQLDHKQFQNFYSTLDVTRQDSLLQQIFSNQIDNNFFNLIYVGKCLSKLRHFESALKLYDILQQQIKQNLNKEYYSIYIQFKILKIQFMISDSNYDQLIKKLTKLLTTIEQYRFNNQQYFQPYNIYSSCLFLNLLLCIYQSKTDNLKNLVLTISKLLFLSDSNQFQRPFTLLQQELFRLINQHGNVFKSGDGEKQLKYITTTISEVCKERQEAPEKKSGFFWFLKGNKERYLSLSFQNYYTGLEEILIINILVRFREINILQYFDPKFYLMFKVIISKKGFFENKQLAHIYFFIHDFELAKIYAERVPDMKLLGQIYEYREEYDKALDAYKKVASPSTEFFSGIIYKIKEQYSFAIDNFRKLESCQNQYKFICQMFKEDIWKKQNVVDVYKNKQEQEQEISQSKLHYNSTYTQKNFISEQLFRSASQRNNMESPTLNQKRYQIGTVVTSEFDTDSESGKSNKQSMNGDVNRKMSEQVKIQVIEFENKLIEKFNLKLRGDVKFFYTNIYTDILELDEQIKKLLDEFVEKSCYFEVESLSLFKNDNYPIEYLGEGGYQSVYKFKYDNIEYAAKKLEFIFNIGEKLTKESTNRFQQALIESCILFDLTISKFKYCMQLKHLGFKFERIGNSQKKIFIYLISDIYDKFANILKWNDSDKIKYTFKLAKVLYTLQVSGLAHLDLKPQNVLIDKQNKTPVLIDFGLSQRKFQSNHDNQFIGFTVAYADPDLLFRNFQSRKNDVYSFGMCLYHYFTGQAPFQGHDYHYIIGQKEKFYELHKNKIDEIKEEFIKNLIITCAKPIEPRISFYEIYKIYFFKLNEFASPQIKQLLELIFAYYQTKEAEKLQPNFSLWKKFLKVTKNFHPLKVESEIAQSFSTIYKQSISPVLPEIIQRVKQIMNWIILNDLKNVVKLTRFEISFKQVGKEQKIIEFILYSEECNSLQQQTISNWNNFFLTIAKTIQEIHNRNICLLVIPLEKLFNQYDKSKNENTIKIGSFAFSQNLKKDSQLTYELNCQFLDPQIQIDQFFSFKNDVYQFIQLVESFKQKYIDEFDDEEAKNFLNFTSQLKQDISIQQIIEILQKN